MILHYNSENDPVWGDIVEFEVNGQIFRELYSVISLNKEYKNNRERAKAFGECLMNIGEGIKNQAEFGNPGEIIAPDGGKVVFF